MFVREPAGGGGDKPGFQKRVGFDRFVGEFAPIGVVGVHPCGVVEDFDLITARRDGGDRLCRDGVGRPTRAACANPT